MQALMFVRDVCKTKIRNLQRNLSNKQAVIRRNTLCVFLCTVALRTSSFVFIIRRIYEKTRLFFAIMKRIHFSFR